MKNKVKVQVNKHHNPSGGIGSVISGGDFLQGAAQGLIVYFANHLVHELTRKTVNLYYNNESKYFTNADIEEGGEIGNGMKQIMSKNGIKLNIINSPDCNDDVGKNDVTLRFVRDNQYFDGNSPISEDGKKLHYEANFVTTEKKFGQGIRSMKEIAYIAAHEIAHQLYNKAQIFFYGKVIDFGEDEHGHFNKTKNLLNSGNMSNGNQYLLPSQFNLIHNFLK